MMNGLKIISILFLIAGAILFGAGLWLFWQADPVTAWASALVMIGILFLLGSIIMLCVALQYDKSASVSEIFESLLS